MKALNTLTASGVFLLAAGTLECGGYLILASYIVVIMAMIYFGSVISWIRGNIYRIILF
jgi:hypothetical protein